MAEQVGDPSDGADDVPGGDADGDGGGYTCFEAVGDADCAQRALVEVGSGSGDASVLGADGGDVIANDPASEDAAQYAVTGGKKKPNISPSTKGLQATSDAVTTSVNPMYIGIGIAALGAIYLLTKKK